jgi:hypothetical protein
MRDESSMHSLCAAASLHNNVPQTHHEAKCAVHRLYLHGRHACEGARDRCAQTKRIRPAEGCDFKGLGKTNVLSWREVPVRMAASDRRPGAADYGATTLVLRVSS